MRVEFDPVKSEKNERERGLPFSDAVRFDFDTSVRAEDLRKDYGEQRMVAYGYIGKRLHVMCFKPIAYRHIRVISLARQTKRR